MEIPKGKERELPSEDTHNAVLVQILDIGTQPSSNPKFKPSRRVLLGYEVIGQKTEEGDAFVVFKNYNFTDNPSSNLMKDLKAGFGLKGPKVDIDHALAKPCMITIEHNETDQGTFANISNVSGLPKGLKPGKHTTPLKTLYLDPKLFDQATFDSLGDKLKAKIAGSAEYAEAVAAGMKKGAKKAAPAKAAKGKKK